MELKNSGKLGEGKADLKRVEIYLTNEVYSILEKEAKANFRKAKPYIEILLTTKAFSLTSKKIKT